MEVIQSIVYLSFIKLRKAINKLVNSPTVFQDKEDYG
jgi:hypothetical protein